MLRLFSPTAAIVCAVLQISQAAAQSDFPARNITIVVPFPAGGTADLLPRIVATQMKNINDKSVIIDNKPGASGNIGALVVSRAEPDGYTLVGAPQLTFSVNHLLHPKLAFDPLKFQPVSVIATYPTVLFARADLPVNSFADLITEARAKPGKLTYASQGAGQIGHLTMEAIKMAAKIDILHVPYRGSAPAINDLLGGQIDLLADNMLSGLQHVQSGKFKILAVGSQQRLPDFPDVPTFNEVVPGIYSDTWMAIAAPPGTPKAIVDLLSNRIAAAIKLPDVTRRIRELQATPYGSTPEEMADMISISRERWEPIIKAGNFTSD
jgi:tripartite-type tricarboxylate transporter receptor subunit TctC